jgi:hypothetical protein
MDAHTLRMLLVTRSRLVSQRQATANTIRGAAQDLWLGRRERQQRPVSGARSRADCRQSCTGRDYRATACGLARHSRSGGDTRSANACIPKGNSFSRSADSRRQRVPLGRGRATPRFSLRQAHRVDHARDIAVPASPTPSYGALVSGRPRKEP